MENVNDNQETRTKIIFSYGIARELMRRGFRCVDLKRNRDTNEVIYVFEDGIDFRESWAKISKENRKARAERAKTAKEGSASDEVDEGPQQED